MRCTSLVAFALITLSACSADPISSSPPVEAVPPTPPTLAPAVFNAPFELVEGIVDGRALRLFGDRRATITLAHDSIGGKAYCNAFGGSLSVANGSVIVGEMEQTAAGCEVADDEQAYIVAVSRVTAMGMDGDALVLLGPDVMLRFVALPILDRDDFAGTEWILELVVDGQVARPPDHPATLELRADGTFRASGGCEVLVGEWIVTGDEFRTPAVDLVSNCGGGAADEDSVFVGVVEGPARLEGDRLRLSGEDGVALVFERRGD